jgi:hypothetical protein
MWIGRKESLQFESREWRIPPCDFAVLVLVVFVGAVVVDSTQQLQSDQLKLRFYFVYVLIGFYVAVHVASGQSTPSNFLAVWNPRR